MKKITLTSILALCMACPAVADIAKEATSATCDNSTIGTTTGPANLQADWTANTINLKWYDGENEIEIANDAAQKTCTYDGAITLPSTPQVPAGYTFGGWKVRQAVAQCSLTGLDPTARTTIDSEHFREKAINYPSGYSLWAEDTDLDNGEWEVVFSHGAVRGIAKCSVSTGQRDGSGYWSNLEGNVQTTISDSAGTSCWCKVTRYTPSGENSCSVTSSSWVFMNNPGNDNACLSTCAYDCAAQAQQGVDAFRAALYGITQ